MLRKSDLGYESLPIHVSISAEPVSEGSLFNCLVKWCQHMAEWRGGGGGEGRGEIAVTFND